MHVIFRLINDKGACIQAEEFEDINVFSLQDRLIQLYLQQRTVKDFCRLAIDIAFPEDE